LKNLEHLTTDKTALENYLKGQGWLRLNEKVIAVEIPGAGNMNFTLRVKTLERSFIVKQSRDYVEKYPQVAAPADRALREAEFYQLVATKKSLSKLMPTLNGVDLVNHVLNLEDLGDSTDFSFLYQKGETLKEQQLIKIVEFVANLHTSLNKGTTQKTLPNREMRKLNHEHIFIYPYLQENGLNLNDILPGLQEIANPYKTNNSLKNNIEKLGERYLMDGNSLLHGDYFPGSWLRSKNGIKIIDPEFCFFGEPEFEIGVTIAHLKMGDQPENIISNALKYYKDRAPLNEELCKQFTSAEIFRRILGLAQLPLTIDLQQRKKLLAESFEVLLKADY